MTGPEFHYEPAHDLGLPPVERARPSAAKPASSKARHHSGRPSAVFRGGTVGEGAFAVLPAPPFVLVANHSSHLDALAPPRCLGK